MGLSEDELYEPSQRPEQAGADFIGVRSSDRRHTTVVAKERITQMYAKGGMLDSQTTDSQFEFATPTSVKKADKLKHSKQDPCHHDSESYYRAGAVSPEALTNKSPVSSRHDELKVTSTGDRLSASADFQHRRQLEQDLVFARVEIQMLRDQVGHLEMIRDLQEERISELRMQLFDGTHMLNPEEQSQVLIEVPRRAPSVGVSAHERATGTPVTVDKHVDAVHGPLGAALRQPQNTYKRKRA
ncbi:hypothetical protein C2E23DRAFT_883994 [Lenzites betulinus]|nr:hypothetical protein C2E23DRAFT_883994 [Lenzites betulinus]